MGCGSSTVGVVPGGNEQTPPSQVHANGTGQKGHHAAVNGVGSTKTAQKKDSTKTTDPNGNTVKLDQTPVPKSVAFDVSLDGQNTQLLVGRRGPRNLQTLEPLNVPKLSAEQLAEKQRQAEEKREKLLQKRASASKKSSRRRQELMRAKEFEAQQQLQQEKALDDHQRQAEIKREARLKEVREKQRIREERAKRARERAKKINQGDNADDIDVEKDDHFNASDADSWLGDEEAAERAPSEHSGPQKRAHGTKRPTASASTVDSYEAAFQRQPRPPPESQDNDLERDDDFFG
ncbi:uncharacterized protein LOC143295774 [Babylonia areolata]|uniref:uncharacterized protein LOC143295774 n=1 Tax=Babylonia areolata TaxID=304850 RepID=UPI003FCFB62D